MTYIVINIECDKSTCFKCDFLQIGDNGCTDVYVWCEIFGESIWKGHMINTPKYFERLNKCKESELLNAIPNINYQNTLPEEKSIV